MRCSAVVSADVATLPAYVGVSFPEGYLLLRVSKVIEAEAKEADPADRGAHRRRYTAARSTKPTSAACARAATSRSIRRIWRRSSVRLPAMTWLKPAST